MKINNPLNLKYKKNLSLSMNSEIKNHYDFSKFNGSNTFYNNSKKKFISTENDIIFKSIKNKFLAKHLSFSKDKNKNNKTLTENYSNKSMLNKTNKQNTIDNKSTNSSNTNIKKRASSVSSGNILNKHNTNIFSNSANFSHFKMPLRSNFITSTSNYIPLPSNYFKNKINIIKVNKSMNSKLENSIENLKKEINKNQKNKNQSHSNSKLNLHKYSYSMGKTKSDISKNILNSESTTQSTDDNRQSLQKEINKIKLLNEKMKNSYENKIKILIEEKNNLNRKYENMLKLCNKLKEENEKFQEKETTFMKIMYFLNKKGINLDKIINDMNYNENETINSYSSENNNNNNQNSTISLTSITFPDKVKMKSNLKNFEKIPLMDFSEVPCYQPSDDEEESESEIINNYIPYQYYLDQNQNFYQDKNDNQYYTGVKINPFSYKKIQQIQFNQKNK